MLRAARWLSRFRILPPFEGRSAKLSSCALTTARRGRNTLWKLPKRPSKRCWMRVSTEKVRTAPHFNRLFSIHIQSLLTFAFLFWHGFKIISRISFSRRAFYDGTLCRQIWASWRTWIRTASRAFLRPISRNILQSCPACVKRCTPSVPTAAWCRQRWCHRCRPYSHPALSQRRSKSDCR